LEAVRSATGNPAAIRRRCARDSSLSSVFQSVRLENRIDLTDLFDLIWLDNHIAAFCSGKIKAMQYLP
jgi:hypothetical protein